MRRIHILLLVVLLFPVLSLGAEPLQLKPDAPIRYVVKQGDSLWGIASMYLIKPWRWRELWERHGKIKDPNRLYPGDVLSLSMHNGQPRLQVSYNGVVKLTPKIRIRKLEEAIPTIQLSDIQPFLIGTRIVERDELNEYPYVVAFTETRLTASLGQKLYARGICEKRERGYSIFRRGDEYIDPENRQSLGYEAIEIGHAKTIALGDPSTMFVTNSVRAVRIGDRLLPAEKDKFDPHFIPQDPPIPLKGSVVSVFGGLTEVGQYQVITINRGYEDGVRNGYVLSIYRGGKAQRDTVVPRNGEFKLPTSEIADFMVFRTFRHISYALVTLATSRANVGDIWYNPS